MDKAKDDLPQVTYTIPQALKVLNTSRATFYKLPPDERPRFRMVMGKKQTTPDELVAFVQRCPDATWDDFRGINAIRKSKSTA